MGLLNWLGKDEKKKKKNAETSLPLRSKPSNLVATSPSQLAALTKQKSTKKNPNVVTFNKKNVITYNTTKPLTIPNCKPAKQVTQQKPQEAQAFDEQFCDNEEQGDYIGKFHGTLPPSWNKDGYHFVTIHVVTRNGGTYGYGGYKTYQGYLWASDNWVEVHCFKFGGLKEQKRYFTGNTKQDEGQQGIHHWITRSGEVVVESMPVYTGRVISAILPRSRVSFQNDQIIISVNKEDKQRWHAWHPEDDYITQFYDSMTYKTYWEVIDRKAW